MTARPPTREELIQQDIQELHRLGYAQQLFREMGGFSNFAISFSIISILTGAVLLYGYGLKFAGPIINSVGWPVVSLFTLCVAASMAELASAYPTAGGLYFWAFRLGGRTWAWTTAWLNMIGQITITAGINVAAAIYIVGAVTRILGLPADQAVPVFGTMTNWYFYVFVMVLIMIPQILINIYGIRLTARLNDFSVYWHIGGVADHRAAAHRLSARITTASTSCSPAPRSSIRSTPPRRTSARGTPQPALVFGEFKFASPLFALVPWPGGALPGGAVRAGLRARAAAGAVDLHRLRRLGPRRRRDGDGAEELRVGRVPLGGGVGGRRLRDAADPDLVHPERRRRGDGQRCLSGAPHRLRQPAASSSPTSSRSSSAWRCGCAARRRSRRWRGCGTPSRATTACPARAHQAGEPDATARRSGRSSSRARWRSLICLYAAAYFVVTSISTITLYLAYMFPIYLNWRNRRRGQGEFTTAADGAVEPRGAGARCST